MNRIIKFRGKCLYSDEWCFGSLVDYGDGEMEIQGFDVFRGGFNKWIEIRVDPDTVGQFTGLHDCEGNEIYEGDIVKDEIAGFCGVIKFKDSAFIIDIDKIKGFLFVCLLTDPLEIVGNIHDNPGLLKGGQNEQTAE